MTKQGLMNKKGQSGFTIVELLIVIVVIAILATITIVSYTGFTQRANTTKAQTNARSVQSVAEIHFAELGTYPTAVADFNSSTLSARLPDGVTLLTGVTALDATNGEDSVLYEVCDAGPGGFRVSHWNFSTGAAVESVEVGECDTAGTASYIRPTSA